MDSHTLLTVNILFEYWNSTKLVNSPISVGSGPENSLPLMREYSREFDNLPISDGNCPSKLFWCR